MESRCWSSATIAVSSQRPTSPRWSARSSSRAAATAGTSGGGGRCATHSRTSSVASAYTAVPRAPTPPAWRPPPLRTGSSTGRGPRAGPGRAARCRPATGASVACVPEPRPRSVVQVPAPGCRLATGTSQPWGGEVGAGEGIRTLDPLLGKHAGCRSRRHNSDVRLQGNCRGNRRSGARSVPLLRRAQRDTGPIIWSPGEKRWWRVAACSER